LLIADDSWLERVARRGRRVHVGHGQRLPSCTPKRRRQEHDRDVEVAGRTGAGARRCGRARNLNRRCESSYTGRSSSRPPARRLRGRAVSAPDAGVGQVTRLFRVGEWPPRRQGEAGRPRTLLSRQPPFSRVAHRTVDRASVRTPQVVGYFRRGPTSARGEANPASVEEHARAGRPRASSRTPGTSHLPPSSAGCRCRGEGEPEPAGPVPRGAPSGLGVLSGRSISDRQPPPAGVTRRRWRVAATVTESDAPFIYTLLGDALSGCARSTLHSDPD
jgi:hypothetical protein